MCNFFFQAEDGIRDVAVTGVQTCALPISTVDRLGLVPTFIPKPIYGRNGSGMHTHQSLFAKGKNAFLHAEGPIHLSEVGRWYIGGLLRHARGYCAVTNPLVNSYKRLVPGFEAPVNVSWSTQNVSPPNPVPAQPRQ